MFRLVAFGITVLFTVFALPNPSVVSAAPPNVMVIMADDLGYSDLGCYGGEIKTPQLDRLADNGLRYTQFYNTARCWPSRAALLTGYYAQQVRRDALPGIPGGANAKRPTWAKLLPEYLKKANYRSYHSGKWHVDGKVLDGGFDRSLDLRNQGNYFTAKRNTIDDVPINIESDEPGYYATEATASHAIECLKDHAKTFGDRPFFHFVAFIAPHFPLHAKPEDIEKYEQSYKFGWDRMRDARHSKQKKLGLINSPLSKLEPSVGPPYPRPDDIKKLGPGEANFPVAWDELTDEQKAFQATKMAIHAAMVDRMDQEIGRIIQQLESMKALENTLILFCSDNGASAEIMIRDGGHDPSAPAGSASTYLCLGPGFSSACNTPHRRHKTWVHEGGISTPLVVHWPAGIKARGELRRTPTHLVDIVPTILELAEVDMPRSWDGKPLPTPPGKSLVKSFGTDIRIERDSLWWLHEGNRAIRVGDWKLVATKDSEWSLYNLEHDRSEENDLSHQFPDKVKELQKMWQEQTDEFVALAKADKP